MRRTSVRELHIHTSVNEADSTAVLNAIRAGRLVSGERKIRTNDRHLPAAAAHFGLDARSAAAPS